MRRVECDSCHAIQPADWSVGDTCYECGAQARIDVACAWCCHYVPDSKFCRDCGFEMVEPDLFAVARMLKASNIDKLSLPAKTRELPADHQDHYRSMYNRDYAVLMTRIEEVRLAEQFLLHKGYSYDLEVEYLERLPFDDDTKAELSAGPKGPFQDRPEKLAEIAESSPIASTRWLAGLAQACCPDALVDDGARSAQYKTMIAQLSADDGALRASEILASLADWRSLPLSVSGRHSFYKTEISPALNEKLQTLTPALWPEMAPRAQVASAPLLYLVTELPELIADQIKTALGEAATSNDEALAFAAHLTGKHGAPLLARIQAADTREPDDKASMAASFLAFYQMPQLNDLLTGEETSYRETALTTLLATADGAYEDHSLQALLQLLRAEPDTPHKDKILQALSGSPYQEDANKILISGAGDDSSTLIAAVARGGDLAPVMDALYKHEISEEMLKALERKAVDIRFGAAWLSKIWTAGTNAEDRSSIHRAAGRLLGTIFRAEGEDAYCALKAGLPDLMAKPETSWRLMKAAIISDFDPAFTAPQRAEPLGFSPTPDQLSLLLEDTAASLIAFGQSLSRSGKEQGGYLVRYVWEPHHDAWLESVLAFPLCVPAMLDAHVAIASNTEIWENTRNTSMKVILGLAPHLEPAAHAALVAQMESLERITPSMHSMIPRLTNPNA